MARRSQTTRRVPTTGEFLLNAYSKALDDVEKRFELGNSNENQTVLSSGSLVFDLISGCLIPGMTTISGMEASAKSTLTFLFMWSAIKAKIPVIGHFDAEGTATNDVDYTAACFRVKSLREIYGEQDNQGNWIIPCKVRRWDTNILEKYFDALVRLFNQLPDKIYHPRRKQWYLRIPTQGKIARRLVNFAKSGTPDAELSGNGYLWIPTNNSPQALIVPDSYVTFMPEGVDEEEEASNALSEQAREYAKHLRRIVGKLRRKQIIIAGVNQLRERPGMVMGPRVYEPAGNALKLFSSLRFSLTSRVVPQNWRHDSKISQASRELSVEGKGYDEYAYKHIRNTKNKNAPPWQEGWMRIWIRDCHGHGRGVDPVFDCWQFFEMIGLASMSTGRGGRRIKFSKVEQLNPIGLSGKMLTWQEFKTLIVAEEYRSPSVQAAAERIARAINRRGGTINLRQLGFQLIRSGQARELRNNYLIDSEQRQGRKRDAELDD